MRRAPGKGVRTARCDRHPSDTSSHADRRYGPFAVDMGKPPVRTTKRGQGCRRRSTTSASTRSNLRESVDFYVELLGAEPIPTPNFGVPVQWLALGRTQLHLFERDLQPTQPPPSRRSPSTTSSPSIASPSAATRSIARRSATISSSCRATSSSSTSAIRRATWSRSTSTGRAASGRSARAAQAACGSSTRRARRTCGAGCSCPTDPRGVYPWRTGLLYDGQVRPATHEHRCRRCAPLTSPASP